MSQISQKDPISFMVIGISDDPQPFFPPPLLAMIRQGRIFSGGKRHHEIVAPLLPDDARWIDITVPLEGVFAKYREIHGAKEESPIIVFASGDPLFFGFANTLRREMPEAGMTVYPSFNSLQTLAHRMLMPYHDMRIVSLTGRPWQEFDRALIERSVKIGVLTDREHTPAAIARRMLDYGYSGYQMYVGEHLGNPSQEQVVALTLEAAATRSFGFPNCLILHNDEDGAQLARPFGIPDSEFALLDGRTKMITKMPIRLLALQALDLPHRHVLWDIGFCTGSVSIEARLQFPHLHVVAFEVRPECEAIISENARRHGAPGIEVHMGDFRSVCCDGIATNGTARRQPDAVFIGGHGGHLKDIMSQVEHVLAPGGIIVMNSVTAQSRQLFEEACQMLALDMAPPERIALNDFNPIEILKATKKK